jgi:hypothetical protein
MGVRIGKLLDESREEMMVISTKIGELAIGQLRGQVWERLRRQN